MLLQGFAVISQSHVVDSLINLYKESIQKKDKDSLCYFLCYEISFYHNEPEKSIEFAELAYKYGINCKNDKWKAASKFLESYSYERVGNLIKAIEVTHDAFKLYNEIGFEEGISSSNLRLAEIYKKNKSYNLSENYYQKAIKFFAIKNDSLKLAASYINLGELYRETGNLDEALLCYNQINSLTENVYCNNYFSYAQGNIGLVYVAQNKLDSAEIHLHKAIEALEPLHDNYAVSSYLDGLAEVYFKRSQFNKAKQTSLKSLHLAQEYGLKEQIRDASLRLSTIYNQFKEFEKAFFHHKQYVAYRDSINNEETIRKIANLRTKYEVAQKQKEVDQEKAQKERYLIVAIAAISILIILTVLVFIILKISRYRKKVNLKLKDQRQELANANATKNKFFSILSHDLRSPLATFHSYSEVMDLCASHQDLDKLNEISREMKSSSANMLDLLDNLLQWGVNQMGTQKSVPANVSLKDVVLMEVKHLQHVSDKKNIIVLTPIEKDVTLFVDRVKLAMAVRNLLNNAIKFTPSGGTITISSYLENTQTILKVSDTGVGMTPEKRDRLFDFTDINSTYGTQNEKGVGLGMQLVYEFVKLSNASIKVESELGVGTTFIITFYNNVS